MEYTPILFAIFVGFTHAFEADHLVAVSNIVTKRNNTILAIKDGVFWGLGHTSTILLIGCIFILGRFTFQETDFKYLESAVGLMLIVLGSYRFLKKQPKPQQHNHSEHSHQLAYGVGLVHGLAGSGAIVLTVLATIKGTLSGILYLLIFGIGSIAGMMLAAGIFSVPFSEKYIHNKQLKKILTLASSVFCIGLGSMIIYENFIK